MLSYAKSAAARPGDRLNGFENGKTVLLLGRWKMSLFSKKVQCSCNYIVVMLKFTYCLYFFIIKL